MRSTRGAMSSSNLIVIIVGTDRRLRRQEDVGRTEFERQFAPAVFQPDAIAKRKAVAVQQACFRVSEHDESAAWRSVKLSWCRGSPLFFGPRRFAIRSREHLFQSCSTIACGGPANFAGSSMSLYSRELERGRLADARAHADGSAAKHRDQSGERFRRRPQVGSEDHGLQCHVCLRTASAERHATTACSERTKRSVRRRATPRKNRNTPAAPSRWFRRRAAAPRPPRSSAGSGRPRCA